ncbi:MULTISPECIES: cytochrome P450 [unclassified Modestobacter]|uniref:cytochrome P450 n=1 Tax=unclassified Modestobacter TaxID=2643866 RepID=UPI0022AABD38|nr:MULTISPECIES: cytochrome P450 [unclassified Modestobacter]MCZ2827004.1 cytochrome P450 [Modestobacter sp. VKM Ac-2981]MCZ2855300.1 cytochrome P450 [Modestobacter sp. VKM Ac-2982]
MILSLTVPDSSLALLREGYTFISTRCDRLGADAFRTRLLLQPAVCLRGAEAAELFYSGARFDRTDAFPPSVGHLLQDLGSVQTLEGDAHRHRKDMFLTVLQGTGSDAVTDALAEEWRRAVPRWQRAGRVVLHPAVNEVLTRAATRWAGVPMSERDVRLRTRELAAMVDQAGTVGPRNWWAHALRNRSERWARGLVTRVRSGDLEVPAGSALAVIAGHRDTDGALLTVPAAGVELLNVLRPIVAVSRYVVFAALALLQHPHWQQTFAAGDEADLMCFVDEVRRLYPFFPLIAGRVRRPFSWQGYDFPVGQRVLLDLYGTDHDGRLWPEPEVFRPERFRDWVGDPYTLIPQGAGDYRDDHRCPGEPMTRLLMAEAVRLLTRSMRYDVGVQDLSVSLSRLPALPRSGFIVHGVQPVAPAAAGATG